MRAKRKVLVTVAVGVVGAIVFSGFSATSTLSASAETPGSGIAARHPEPPAPVKTRRSLVAAPTSGMSRLQTPAGYQLRKEDPLGFAMLMARVREFERLVEAERQRKIRKAKAARKRALAKKRAAAKRRAEAKKRAAEKKRAAAKRAEAKRKQAEIDSAAARERGGLVIGDSVALGAESCLVQRGFQVDAVQSRSFAAGSTALRQKPQSSLPANVVIHLGTNGPFSASDFHAVMSHIGGDRHVTWVTIALPDRDPYGFESSLNSMIKDLAGSYSNTSIADWNRVSQGMGHWFYDDQIHIGAQGCEGFANVVDAAGR